ncbi:Threonine efflux protein [Paraburkholderia caffeinitolerans]|uniref:Threonine efflux protein n=1 Tax=Paraburkholderia caffeinitolerans TaxID=1723730 RepID=A0A6J5G8D9_9BURK|nr:Threonine efflux protein [Paraburkholderia caffeinitolerans]
MDYISTLLTLAGVLLLSVASPGPNFVIVTSSAAVSRRAGMATGIGLAAASGTWALIAITGLRLVFSHTTWIEAALRFAGAVYLIWLGIKMIRTARQPLPDQDRSTTSDWSAAKKGYLVSMTNPKSVAFYGSVFALLVPAHAPTWLGVAVVGLAVGISCGWYCAMALLASHPAIRLTLIRRKAVLDSTAGVVLVALGSRMLVTR